MGRCSSRKRKAERQLVHNGYYYILLIHYSFYKFIYLFIFGCAGSLLLHRLFSSYGEWRLLSSCSKQASHCSGPCSGAQALGSKGFSDCGVRASAIVAPGLQSTGSVVVGGGRGLVAPRHAGSSQTRDQTRVFCIGRWILYH